MYDSLLKTVFVLTYQSTEEARTSIGCIFMKYIPPDCCLYCNQMDGSQQRALAVNLGVPAGAYRCLLETQRCVALQL